MELNGCDRCGAKNTVTFRELEGSDPPALCVDCIIIDDMDDDTELVCCESGEILKALDIREPAGFGDAHAILIILDDTIFTRGNSVFRLVPDNDTDIDEVDSAVKFVTTN